jgi:hypothetical protein
VGDAVDRLEAPPPLTSLYIQQPGDANAISYTDINQIGGNCYFLAALGALARNNPARYPQHDPRQW